MLQLDDNFLADLGLGAMPVEEKKAFLSYIRSELELRIGTELSGHLTDEDLAEFETISQSEDSDAASAWLEKHCPNYEEVADRQLEQLRQEIMAGKDLLLSNEA